MPTLEITTMIGCPQRCTYCPQDSLIAAYGDSIRILELGKFRSILEKLPKFVRVDFSGMAEPWANRAATDMLESALGEGFNVAIYTTLIGMTDPARVLAAIRWNPEKVETVVVHLPDKNGNMRGFKPSKTFIAAFELFRSEAANNERIQFMTMDPDGGVHPSVDLAGSPLMEWRGHSRAGSLPISQIGEQPLENPEGFGGPVSCSFTPFYDQNVMLPNGDVYLCCMDYGLKHKIGNLFDQDYYEIFASPELTALRLANMRSCGETICKSCHRANRYEMRPGAHQSWETMQ